MKYISVKNIKSYSVAVSTCGMDVSVLSSDKDIKKCIKKLNNKIKYFLEFISSTGADASAKAKAGKAYEISIISSSLEKATSELESLHFISQRPPLRTEIITTIRSLIKRPNTLPYRYEMFNEEEARYYIPEFFEIWKEKNTEKMEKLSIIQKRNEIIAGEIKPVLNVYLKNKIQNAISGNSHRDEKWLETLIMSDDVLSKIENIENKEVEKSPEYLEFLIRRKLHDEQKQVFDCKDNDIIVLAPRRWGKSFVMMALIIVDAMIPGHRVLYVGNSIDEAEDQFKLMLEDFNQRIGLPYGKSCMDFIPESSLIDTWGLSPNSRPSNTRGRKYSLVVYDEFFHLRPEHLEEFSFRVIGPMRRNYKNAREIRVGTPPDSLSSYQARKWFEETSWKHFHFTDPDANKELEQFIPWFKKTYPLRDINSVDVRREYYAEMVENPKSKLINKYTSYKELNTSPKDIEQINFGIDYGFTAYNTVVGAIISKSGNIEIFYEKKINRETGEENEATVLEQLIDVICHGWNLASDLLPRELTPMEKNSMIRWYADCSAKTDTQQIRKSCISMKFPDLHIRITDALKTNDKYIYDIINQYGSSGTLKIPEGGLLQQDFSLTLCEIDKNTGKYIEGKMARNTHSDLIPALRYALAPYIIKREKEKNSDRTVQ